MNNKEWISGRSHGWKVLLLLPVLFGCAGSGEGAVKGAAGGALAGAASGLVSSIIWGGDPAEHMARGAAAGATIGAIGGAVEGSSRAKSEQQRQAAMEQQEIEIFRRDIGNESFDGIVALAECKHELAIAHGREATKSTNSNHALAGIWVQALTYADQGDEQALNAIMPEIVQWDRAIDDVAAARSELAEVHSELMGIRVEYRLPRVCS